MVSNPSHVAGSGFRRRDDDADWRVARGARLRGRVQSTAVDLTLAGLLPAGLALAAALLRAGGRDTGEVFRRPETADLAQFAVTVLPTGVWFTGWEASGRHATPGKRAAGLTVRDRYGAPPSTARVAARTAVKLLPWQLAHVCVTRIARAPATAPGPSWPAQVGLAVSLCLAAGSAALAATRRDGRALHDLVAGTAVAQANSPAGMPDTPGPHTRYAPSRR